MSIGFQASAVGGKTATSGTTFTLVLNSTAGDVILVAISLATVTGSVSSITDNGGNTYHRIGSLVSGSGTVTTELWKTDSVNPAASGTLTVTVNTTGFRAQGVAASYRGVSFAGSPSQTNSGTTSPLTTGSLTLKETNSWIVTAGGLAANNAFSQQNGSLRNQSAGTTALKCCLIDSNDNASPITNSATMTAAAWTTVSVELRLLEVTQLENLSNWNDGLNPLWIQISDDLNNWSEGFLLSKFISDSLILSDSVAVALGVQRIVSDTLSASEGVAVGYGDSVADQFYLSDLSGYGYVPYGFVPFGGEGIDLSFLGYGNVVTDSIGLSDDFAFNLSSDTSVLTENLSDSIAFSDSLQLGYGDLTTDSLTLSDSLVLGYGDVTSDALALSDLVSVGYGELLSDSLTLSDSLSVGYGSVVVEQISLSESLLFGYGDLIIDSVSLTDSLAQAMVLSATASDQLSLSDSLATGIGFGIGLSDSLTFSDNLLYGYGALIADFLSLSDSLIVGYGNSVSDSNSLADNLTLAMVLFQSPSDTMTLTDSVSGIGYGNVANDSLSLSDTLAVGYGNRVSDQISLSESLVVGYGDSLADSFTLTDVLSLAMVLSQSLSDVLTLTDLISKIGYALVVTEQLTLSDGVIIRYEEILSDSMSISDNYSQQLSAGGLTENLSDALTLLDVVASTIGYLPTDSLLMSDQMVVELALRFSDSITLLDISQQGYGLGSYGGISFGGVGVDPSFLGYGDLVSDALTLTDFAQINLPTPSTFSAADTLSMSDSVRVGYGNVIAEQLVLTEKVASTIVLLISEQLSMNDFFIYFGQFQQMTLSFSEQLFQNDVSGYGYEPYGQAPYGGFVQNGEFLGYGNLITDLLSMSDAFVGITNLITAVFTDQLVLTDAFKLGFGLLFSEPFVYVQQQASDTFNRPDENPIDPANWTQVSGLTPLQVSSQRATATSISPSKSGENYTGISWPNDQYAEITLERSFQFSGLEIVLRSDANQQNCYNFSFFDNEDGTASLAISKIVAGVKTVLWQAANVSFYFVPPPGPPGSKYRAVALGNRLLLYQNDVLVGSAVDNTFASGVGGLNVIANAAISNLQVQAWSVGSAFGMQDRLVAEYKQPVADSLSQTDSIQTFIGLENGIAVADSFAISDKVILGIGLLPIDVVSWSESVTAVINGLLITDQLVINDQLAFFINSMGLSDTMQTLSDQLSFALGGTASALNVSDQMTLDDAFNMIVYITQMGDQLVMSDSFLIGYGAVIAEQMTLSEAVVRNLAGSGVFPQQLSDTLALVDRLGLGYGSRLSDSLSLTDSIIVAQVLQQVVADSLAQLDSLSVGYGLSVTDQLSFADSLITSSPVVSEQLVDSLSLLDSLSAGYGNVISDQLTLLDSVVFLFPVSQAVSDQLSLSERVAIGYGSGLVDSVTILDAVTGIGYGDIITDQLVQSDAFFFALLGALISLFPNDQLVFSDSLKIGYGLLPEDQQTLTEQLIVGYGNRVSDQLTLTDQVNFAFVLSQSLSDTMTLTDLLRPLSVGLAISDQLALSEALLIGLGYIIAEQMVFVDGPIVSIGLILSDQQTTLAESLVAGYGNTVTDTVTTQNDSMALVFSLLEQLTDANINQLDAFSALLSYALTVSDAVVFQEQMSLLWGMIIGDSTAMVDSLNPMLVGPLSLALAEPDVANWLDSVLNSLVFAPSTIVLNSLSVVAEIKSGMKVTPQVQTGKLIVTKAEV